MINLILNSQLIALCWWCQCLPGACWTLHCTWVGTIVRNLSSSEPNQFVESLDLSGFKSWKLCQSVSKPMIHDNSYLWCTLTVTNTMNESHATLNIHKKSTKKHGLCLTRSKCPATFGFLFGKHITLAVACARFAVTPTSWSPIEASPGVSGLDHGPPSKCQISHGKSPFLIGKPR
jgi:hypothetical protein